MGCFCLLRCLGDRPSMGTLTQVGRVLPGPPPTHHFRIDQAAIGCKRFGNDPSIAISVCRDQAHLPTSEQSPELIAGGDAKPLLFFGGINAEQANLDGFTAPVGSKSIPIVDSSGIHLPGLARQGKAPPRQERQGQTKDEDLALKRSELLQSHRSHLVLPNFGACNRQNITLSLNRLPALPCPLAQLIRTGLDRPRNCRWLRRVALRKI
jgi:hypothetical protein